MSEKLQRYDPRLPDGVEEMEAVPSEVGEWCLASDVAALEAERDALRRYVGTEMLRSDFRTAAELRAAYEGALKSLDVAMREVASKRRPMSLTLPSDIRLQENTDADPLCAATMERIRKEQ